MLLGLGIFDEFVNGIEHKGRQRLPMEQRKSFELQRLVRTVDMHACLRESFPRELQLLLRIVEYGPDEAWKDSEVVRAPLRAFAGPAPDGVSEAAGPVIERALTRSCSQPERGPPPWSLTPGEGRARTPSGARARTPIVARVDPQSGADLRRRSGADPQTSWGADPHLRQSADPLKENLVPRLLAGAEAGRVPCACLRDLRCHERARQGTVGPSLQLCLYETRVVNSL